MLKYILKRFGYLLLVIIAISFVVFTLLYFTPGDPARMILGEAATDAAKEELRNQLGLNDPFIVQYFRYFTNMVFRGDLGTSYYTKRPVLTEIMSVMPNTIILAVVATILASVFGILMGVVSAVKQYSLIDAFVTVFSLIGTSVPIFWYGLLMILMFSVNLGWFPPSGFSSIREMILPSIALGIQSTSMIARMTRSSMLEVLHQDYVNMARSKGQREIVVIFNHILRNSLVPIITVIGIQFGSLLGGACFTEIVFSIPGLGRLMVESIKMRDYPVVLGGVFFAGVFVSFVNWLADILYAVVDPRIART
jgi:peptide/nickel transport system permease protein